MAATGKDQQITPQAVIEFWKQAGPRHWFAKDEAFDTLFRDTFYSAHFLAASRKLEHWLAQPEGALALLLLLGAAVFGHLFKLPPRYFERRPTGVLVSMVSGRAVAYALDGLQERAEMFVAPGDEVYEGMIVGENSRTVSRAVAARLEEINDTLPDGVTAEAVYDRTVLVEKTIATVRNNLLEGCARERRPQVAGCGIDVEQCLVREAEHVAARDAAAGRVRLRAAKELRVHLLVGDGADDVGPRDEHVRRPAHHIHEVGDRRGVDRSARARPHHERDLRDDARRLHVAPEDLRVARERDDELLRHAGRDADRERRAPLVRLQDDLLDVDPGAR